MKVGSDILKKKTGVVAQDLLLSFHRVLQVQRPFTLWQALDSSIKGKRLIHTFLSIFVNGTVDLFSAMCEQKT